MNALNPSRNLATRSRAACFVNLLVLAGLLATVAPLRADSPPTYLFQWGSYGTGNGQFSDTGGIAIDSSNNVYVSDSSNPRVEKFDRNGNYLTQWGTYGTGHGQFNYPFGVAVDSNNNVYVVDQSNSRIEKFDRNGNYLRQWGSSGSGNGQFNFPWGIAVDSSNNVYVTDNFNSRVEKFDSNGNYLTQWGSYGAGNGQFNGLPGVAIDSGNNVYVTDSGHSRVEKFDSNGNYLLQWGSSGTGNGQFSGTDSQFLGPYAIAVDRSNNVYVTDPGNYRVEKFDSNGNYLTQWISLGSNPSRFNGVAVDKAGNYIYIAELGSRQIEVFANNTSVIPPYITQQPTNQTVLAGVDVTFTFGVIGATPFAYQWASNSVLLPGATNATLTLTNANLSANVTYSVLVTNSFGSVLSSNAVLTVIPAYITTLPASGISTTGAVLNGSVTVAEDTVVWFDWGRDTNYGNIVGTTLVPAGSGTTNLSASLNGLTDTFYHYRVVATNGAGIVYGNDFGVGVAVPPTYLFEIDSSAVPGGFEPRFLGLDQAGNIYASDGQSNRVVKFDGGGSYLTSWGSIGTNNGQFNFPFGVAIDSSNNVYVADDNNYRIEKFDSNGGYLSQWGGAGTSNGQFEYPSGIAVDSSNNVYVTDGNNFRIEKFDTNGNYLSQWGSVGAANGQFEYPAGIAIDSSNNIYVADDNNDRIEKFDGFGNYLTQWGGYGTGNSQFHYAVGVAVDSSNNVYVSDGGNNRVEKFDSAGNYLTQWGNYGTGNGQFNDPNGVAVNGNLIYVADYYNHRIQVFVNNPNIVPPIIMQQPTNQTVFAGVNVTFSVGVVGTAPLAYQWTSNNVAVPGATNVTFTLTNVSLSASGSIYSVLVTNSYGSILSSNAVLTFLTAMAITQPASGISATGAVLHGSVTIGSDVTLAWFEWGTDTSYGNIAGATIVPGNNGSNNISAALSGLSGNFYHYRLNAANDFGIIYGNDQSFTVGFAPTVTTLAAVNSANGSTLNATVNPNGWDTTVYFHWGTSSSFPTNSTPGMNIGADGTPQNVSSFLTGLAPFTQYYYLVVASNYLGLAIGAHVAFSSPPFVTVPGEDWTSVASSADGSVMVAVANPGSSPTGPIYISTNSGAIWNRATNAPLGRWQAVACSADGSKIIAAEGGGGGSLTGPIYTSADTGATWVSNNAPVAGWESVASSADGTKLAAADLSARMIYTSTNSGATWAQATNAPRLGWYSIATSADGTKLAAVAGNVYFPSPGATNIYTSTNFGATWITNTVPASPSGIQNNWTAIASSADGSKLIAAGGRYNSLGFGYIFVSTNFGASWTLTATNILPSHGHSDWIYVASSADGSKLAAVSESTLPGGVITSTNSGATWITNSVPNLTWNSVALSADGARMAVTVGYPSLVGPIYTTQTTPSPDLNLSIPHNNTAISWLIPSLDFTLQQSSNLMSWAAVTNPPVLNLTNLENQVLLPPPNGNNFFRLMH